jgi:hypothetical protein
MTKKDTFISLSEAQQLFCELTGLNGGMPSFQYHLKKWELNTTLEGGIKADTDKYFDSRRRSFYRQCTIEKMAQKYLSNKNQQPTT